MKIKIKLTEEMRNKFQIDNKKVEKDLKYHYKRLKMKEK